LSIFSHVLPVCRLSRSNATGHCEYLFHRHRCGYSVFIHFRTDPKTTVLFNFKTLKNEKSFNQQQRRIAKRGLSLSRGCRCPSARDHSKSSVHSLAIFPPQLRIFAFVPAASASLMLPARLLNSEILVHPVRSLGRTSTAFLPASMASSNRPSFMSAIPSACQPSKKPESSCTQRRYFSTALPRSPIATSPLASSKICSSVCILYSRTTTTTVTKKASTGFSGSRYFVSFADFLRGSTFLKFQACCLLPVAQPFE